MKPVIIAGLLLLAAFPLAYSTWNGYLIWYWLVPRAQVTSDGWRAGAWLHRHNSRHGTMMFLTIRDRDRHHSYRIVIPTGGRTGVTSCGDWTAARFLFVLDHHLNPPCFSIVPAEAAPPKAEPIDRRIETGEDFVAFTSDDGRWIRTSW